MTGQEGPQPDFEQQEDSISSDSEREDRIIERRRFESLAALFEGSQKAQEGNQAIIRGLVEAIDDIRPLLTGLSTEAGDDSPKINKLQKIQDKLKEILETGINQGKDLRGLSDVVGALTREASEAFSDRFAETKASDSDDEDALVRRFKESSQNATAVDMPSEAESTRSDSEEVS